MVDEILIDDVTEEEWFESAENEPEVDADYEAFWASREAEWPDERGDEQCLTIFERVEQAPLVKPRGECLKETAPDGVVWNL